jgi:predicted acyltransferase
LTDDIEFFFKFNRVLQRIAFCYLIAATLHLTMSLLFQWIVVFGLVGIYLGLMYGLDVPGCGNSQKIVILILIVSVRRK